MSTPSEPLTPSPDRPLLRFEGVTVESDDHAAVRKVDLAVRRGEVTAITSLDAGDAKSTVLRLAAGLLEPDAGRVLFDDVDVYRMGYVADQRFRRAVGVVPRGGALLANRTIFENVALPLRYHQALAGRELELKVTRALELTGFAEPADRLPEAVSPRGRRLASFARALILDPALVLVDRFFDDLELRDWRRLFELILRLNQRERITWLLVCDLDPLVFQIAERVGVLDRSRLLAFDYRQALFRDPRIKQAYQLARKSAEMRASTRMHSLRAQASRIEELEALDAQATLSMDDNLVTPAPSDDALDSQATLDLTSEDSSPEWERRLLAQLDEELESAGDDPAQDP